MFNWNKNRSVWRVIVESVCQVPAQFIILIQATEIVVEQLQQVIVAGMEVAEHMQMHMDHHHPSVSKKQKKNWKKNLFVEFFLLKNTLWSSSFIKVTFSMKFSAWYMVLWLNYEDVISGRKYLSFNWNVCGSLWNNGFDVISDMHHPALQSDFQPPYFPPPFHHTTQSPPQQQNHSTHGIEYLGAADPYGHVVSIQNSGNTVIFWQFWDLIFSLLSSTSVSAL